MLGDAPHNINELLQARVTESPDKEFLLVENDDRVFTYAEFDRQVGLASQLLVELGVAKGDRVSLLLTNSAEYLFFYFACFRIGAWAGPINALLKPQEIEFVISNSEAETVVTQPDLLPHLVSIRERVRSLRNVVLVESYKYSIVSSRTGTKLNGTCVPDISREDEAVIIYTSGTTGKPKGVLLTHGNILSNAQQIAEWLGLTDHDRALMIMPLFHVNALMTTGMAALWAAGSIVLAPRFSASKHWHSIAKYGATYFGSVATMLSLLNHTYPEGVPRDLNINSLRFALCGSAPVPVNVMRTFESLFGCPVIEGYGLSESTCRSTFNPVSNRVAGSVGLPIGNEVRVVDDEDRELAPNVVGEIVLRGPNVMKGYYKNHVATAEAFRSGWFHTGDVGYKDTEGFFYIVDRKSDLIIRAGENIYPREIDEVLYQHPAVKDAATIGVPDELYGEEVRSFVVVKTGERVTEKDMLAFCRERLADFKCPKKIEFLDEIPKGPTGKLLKRELGQR